MVLSGMFVMARPGLLDGGLLQNATTSILLTFIMLATWGEIKMHGGEVPGLSFKTGHVTRQPGNGMESTDYMVRVGPRNRTGWTSQSIPFDFAILQTAVLY